MARIAHMTETGMHWPVALEDAVRKFAPLLPSARRRREQRELKRLAQISPHLLTDLGFRPDPSAGDAGLSVWRHGTYLVTIETDAEGAVSEVEVQTGG